MCTSSFDLHVCQMWEHGGCLGSVQQAVVSGCGHLDFYDIGTWARAKGAGTILVNSTGRVVARCNHFCGGAECMCQHSCT
jgi:hypothetical protein